MFGSLWNHSWYFAILIIKSLIMSCLFAPLKIIESTDNTQGAKIPNSPAEGTLKEFKLVLTFASKLVVVVCIGFRNNWSFQLLLERKRKMSSLMNFINNFLVLWYCCSMERCNQPQILKLKIDCYSILLVQPSIFIDFLCFEKALFFLIKNHGRKMKMFVLIRVYSVYTRSIKLNK